MTNERFLHKIDDLGRILLPNELQKELGWDIADTISLCRVSGTLVISLEKKNDVRPDCCSGEPIQGNS